MNYTLILSSILGAGLLQALLGRYEVTLHVNLNIIAKQIGVPDTVTNELKILISEGKKIETIKKYRMVTGLGLVEAKEYVDSLCVKKC